MKPPQSGLHLAKRGHPLWNPPRERLRSHPSRLFPFLRRMKILADHIRSRFTRLFSECVLNSEKKERRREYVRKYMNDVYRKDHPSLNVTLSKSEYRRLRKEAKVSGRKCTAFLREAAFAYLDQRYLVPESLEEALYALTYQLTALGNNLNQIAKHVNTQRRASSDDLSAARSLLEHAEDLITSFVRNPPQALPLPPSHLANGDQKHES